MEDGKEGLRAAFEELIHAIQAKDVESGIAALSSFMEQCEMQEDGEGEEKEKGYSYGGKVGATYDSEMYDSDDDDYFQVDEARDRGERY